MIRRLMNIRPSELIAALLVASGVVVFGSVEEARAGSISSVCASLDWWETSDWFCEDGAECRSEKQCVRIYTSQNEYYELEMKFWKDRQIRIHKYPPIGGCAIVDSRCPGWLTSDCGPAGGYSKSTRILLVRFSQMRSRCPNKARGVLKNLPG